MAGGRGLRVAHRLMRSGTARRHGRSGQSARFVPIVLVLGLLAGGLGVALDALPAAAAAPDGSGTMTVPVPNPVVTGSTGNLVNIRYTAASGGLSSGEIDVTVPAGWSAPSLTGSAPGYTTAPCGTVAVVGSTIVVTGVTLAGGSSCTILYGDLGLGGPGVTAPSSPRTSTFTTQEKSTAGGTLTALASSPQVSVVNGLVFRVFGPDAIGTTLAVSAEFGPGSVSGVVLARSDFFADALAGGPLAAFVKGPLLITPGTPLSSSLDPRVLTEIQRVLKPGGTVYILGGAQALSTNIDGVFTTAGYVVKRIAGPNEFATAVAITNQLGDPPTIFEATGLNFPDALSAVPAAIHDHGAILLTNGTTQSVETATYLSLHPGGTRYVIGGPVAAYQDPKATPIYGEDEFGTSAAVATMFFPKTKVYGAATGLNYPDALAGGALLGTIPSAGPMLLVNTNAPLPPNIFSYLRTLAVGTEGVVFGGPIAVGDDVLAALQAAVG